MTKQLRVDWSRCDGRGLCSLWAPDLVELDDWGFPVVRHDRVVAQVAGQADDAVRACPRFALRIIDRS